MEKIVIGTTNGDSPLQKTIGKHSSVFVVAEAACNHMCNMNLAKKMIEKAADAGADAIKFQTYTAEKLVTNKAMAFWGKEKISQLEYYKRLDRFGREEYIELFDHALTCGIIGFSSPFDEENAEMLAEIGMPVFKIASCDIPNLQLLKQIAHFGRPIILSTGASTEKEIDQAVETILQINEQLILLACTLSYPTKFHDANFSRIQTLQKRYPEFIIGISDHTEPDPNMVIPPAAVALGAKVVEKHYTLDRSMTGSGHFFAVNPEDLRKMVENIRITESIIGSGKLGVAESEKGAWESARRSVVAIKPIKQGETIEEDMLGFKRPAQGISPDRIDNIIGKRALADIPVDEFLNMNMFED